jgi:chorismate-pyruvate lyase
VSVRRHGVLPCVLGLTGSLLVTAVPARTPDAPIVWRDDFTSRVEVLALLQSLNADLLSHPSATLTLERWCGAHDLAPEAKVVAERVHGVDKPLPEGAREQLNIGPDETVRYRRVQLACGGRILSEADNWYVPGRLTDAMNHELDATDTPFGKVVQPLHFRRQTLSAELLWSPLPQGWESGAPIPPSRADALAIPRFVLQHRALLYDQANRPFSLVVESYTSDVLAFTPTRPDGHP